MNKIPAAQFRSMFHTLEEPMMVTRYSDTIGTWYPGEHECAAHVEGKTVMSLEEAGEVAASLFERTNSPTTWPAEKEALEEEIRQLKRKLARTSPNWQKFPSEGGFGYPRPVPKPKSK